MPQNLALSFRINANTAAAVQAVAQLQRQLQAAGATQVSNPVAGLQSNLTQAQNAAVSLRSVLGDIAGGTAFAAGLTMSAQAAIRFESAVADVRKVVDGSAEEVKGLVDEITKMSRVVPVSQEGLLDIAAAAGQMGVALKDIPAFTTLTAKASTAFGMLPREAGDAFASLSSIFRLSVKDLETVSDTVNTLGNTTAASERAIIDVLTRVGSTGQAMGLNIDQIASFAATTLPLVGGQSERASTALNSLFTQLATITTAEPKARKAFEALGFTAEGFAKSMREDAGGALKEFFERLNSLNKANRIEILSTAFGRESADEILSLAGAMADYEKAIGGVSDKTKTAGAVNREFEVRVQTTEAQLQLAKNAFNEVAVNLGTVFLPAIVSVAKSVSAMSQSLASFAKDNPGFVQGITTMVGAVLGLRAATTALRLVLPGLAAATTAAGAAAATAAGAGGMAAMSAQAVALLKSVGSLKVGLLGLIAVVPAYLAAVAKTKQFDRAQDGSSKDVADAQAGLYAVQERIKKLKATYADDPTNQAYLSLLRPLIDAEKKASDTVTQRMRDQAKASQQAVENAKAEREVQLETERLLAKGRKEPEYKDLGLNGGSKGGNTGGTKSGDGAAEAKRIAEQYAQALRQYNEAEIEAASVASAALRDLATTQLEADLDGRLVSQREYLAKKAALERQALADERKALEARRDLLAQDLAAAATDPAAQQRAKAQLVQLDAELKALDAREVEVDVRLKADVRAFQRSIDTLSVDIQANLLDAHGQPYEAGLARLRARTAEMLKDPRVQAGGLDGAVREQDRLEAQRLMFDEQSRLMQARKSEGLAVEAAIAEAVATGQKSTADGEREVQAARHATAAAIEANVRALQDLADKNPNNLVLAEAARQATTEYRQLQKALNETATSINGELAGAARGFVQGIVEGESAIRSLGNALADVFGNLAKRFLDQFEKDLFNALQGQGGQGLGGLLSGLFGSSGGGFGGLISGIGSMLGFAEGGFNGSGGGRWTGIGDKYTPTGVVHANEFVFNARAVRRLGLPYLFALHNAAARGKGFAEGGFGGGLAQTGGLASVVKNSFSPTIHNSVNPPPVNLFLDPDVFARAMGESAEFRRSVRRVLPDTN